MLLGHLFREANSFPRALLEENCEQIMSNDNYPSIFSFQMEAVFVILQIFFATRAVSKLGIIRRYSQSRDAFIPIARERKCFTDYK